ncbi:MAG: inositol monophosphatase family protein, partial [Candidatus Binatia bacterium]|nr:inositol monophosphatase family protein [Candidatus Binatia bacterium]
MDSFEKERETALALVEQAGELTLKYFGKDIAVETKADDSPVTVADRGAEALIREGLEAAFPDDGILGEELGEKKGSSVRRWIIDPIDGTQSFIRGVPFYGTLVGLEMGEEVPLGIMGFPALSMNLWAVQGQGAWRDGQRLRVSEVDQLADATVLSTDASPGHFGNEAEAFGRILERCGRQRGWGDCYGYALVAMGQAEAMFDPILAPWDCAPMLPILEEAGGVFVDWRGNRTIHGLSG